MHWRRTRRRTRDRLARIAALLFAAGFLLPDISAAIHGPACPHHGHAPRSAGGDAARHAGEAGHLPAGHAAQHEDGSRRSEPRSGSGGSGTSPTAQREDGAHPSGPVPCTCVGACHAGGALPVVPSGAVVAAIGGATQAPATRRDDPHPPAPAFLLPFANAPPVPLLG